jgi:multiple sugar transport system ATP-binding protein
MAGVVLENIRKSYGNVDVIKGVDLEINDGEFTVFVGPSGCGKSTLLRMIAGLEDISAGDMFIGEKRVNELPPKDRSVAMVFQSYAIFPHMTVRENIGFGLTIAKTPKAEKDSKVQEAARILQMEHLLDRRPSQLSGGQRQRVAIGRAITRKPEVFLFDEPLSNLDAALRMDMRMEIGKLHQQLGATMIYVTHDQVEAMTLADKIVVLKDGEVMQAGTPMDLYHHPKNLFVAGFLGAPSMNFSIVDIIKIDGEHITVKSDAIAETFVNAQGRSFAIGDKATLGLRPQYLSIVEPEAASMTGTVVLTERLGSETVLNIRLTDGTTMIAAIAEDQIFDKGQSVGLAFDAAKAHLFDELPLETDQAH